MEFLTIKIFLIYLNKSLKESLNQNTFGLQTKFSQFVSYLHFKKHLGSPVKKPILLIGLNFKNAQKYDI